MKYENEMKKKLLKKRKMSPPPQKNPLQNKTKIYKKLYNFDENIFVLLPLFVDVVVAYIFNSVNFYIY